MEWPPKTDILLYIINYIIILLYYYIIILLYYYIIILLYYYIIILLYYYIIILLYYYIIILLYYYIIILLYYYIIMLSFHYVIMLSYYYIILMLWCWYLTFSGLGEPLAASQDSEWQWVHPMSPGPDNCLHGSWKVGWLCLGETGIKDMSLFQWLKSWKKHEKPSSSSRSCLRLRCLRCRILQDQQWELCPMSWGNDLPCGERSLVNQAKGLSEWAFQEVSTTENYCLYLHIHRVCIQWFHDDSAFLKEKSLVQGYWQLLQPKHQLLGVPFLACAKPLSLQVVLSGWKHPVVSSMILLCFRISFTFLEIDRIW